MDPETRMAFSRALAYSCHGAEEAIYGMPHGTGSCAIYRDVLAASTSSTQSYDVGAAGGSDARSGLNPTTNRRNRDPQTKRDRGIGCS